MIRNLSVSFQSRGRDGKALRSVSCELGHGEVLGLVGESGCGKTVLTQSILRLLPPGGSIVNGQILFAGQDILHMGEDELRRLRGKRISVVFQNPMSALDPVFTIGYQLDEVLRRHTSLGREERKTRVLELLRMVEIDLPEKRYRQYPHELSGGMRQRVLIAMAIACSPDLLIADEATTSLDVTLQAQILALLQRLRRQSGMAVLFVTHDFSVASGLCDRIAVMYCGKIVEEGTKNQILAEAFHPYTQGLLRCASALRSTSGPRLFSIPGQPPDLHKLPPGCAFAPRCPWAMQICAKREPPVTPLSTGHKVACWMVQKQAHKL